MSLRRFHVARKRHHCTECGLTIEPGDRYEVEIQLPGESSYLEPDGYRETVDWPFGMFKTCPRCQARRAGFELTRGGPCDRHEEARS